MLSAYHFSHPLRVRYSEIDGQKIVFNAHYSTYIDVAMTEYFREVLGRNWVGLAEEQGFDLVLRKITIEFDSPARLDDWLDVHCRVDKMGNKSLTTHFAITRNEEVLVKAEAVSVCYSTEKSQSQHIPDEVKRKIAQFEGITYV